MSEDCFFTPDAPECADDAINQTQDEGVNALDYMGYETELNPT